MYMTSSPGLMWNSLRYSRPRATKARESGSCQRTLTRRPVAASSSPIFSRSPIGICRIVIAFSSIEHRDAVDLDVDAGAVRRRADAGPRHLLAVEHVAKHLVEAR